MSKSLEEGHPSRGKILFAGEGGLFFLNAGKKKRGGGSSVPNFRANRDAQREKEPAKFTNQRRARSLGLFKKTLELLKPQSGRKSRGEEKGKIKRGESRSGKRGN